MDIVNRNMNKQTVTEENANKEILSKIEDLKNSDILRVLNASYIAERFFGKSKSWFSQKINNHIINGIPAEFTPSEIEVLKNALYTISIEIQELADDL